jgi:uncharacterized tellurite resistance protein B-like protein
MPSHINSICDLIDNKKNPKNEKEFKLASATLVCDVVHNVIGANKSQKKKYCSLFKERFNLQEEELEDISKQINTDRATVDEKIQYIKRELGNNKFEIMEFLKIINRFVILNNCSQESYREFEIIRDKFIEEFYQR